jgi:DNA-binding winged helix-turn-helix (wHTH) protein
VDPTGGQLWRHSQVIDLPPRALAVLCQPVARAGQLVTKEALLAAGWPGTVVSEWVLTKGLSVVCGSSDHVYQTKTVRGEEQVK